MKKLILVLIVLSFGFSNAETVQIPLRVLIFTAPFGSGHDTAAKRIKDVVEEYAKANGQRPEIIVKNTMEFAPQKWAEFAMKMFTRFQSNFPILYTISFEHYLSQAYRVHHAGEMKLFKQLGIKTKDLDSYIAGDAFKDELGQPVAADLIFSTWPGSTEALIYLRKNAESKYHKLSSRIPLAHVQTDNAANDRYFQLFAQGMDGDRGADVVYVPSREVYDAYRNLGFNNVIFTGMPLRLKSKELPSMQEMEELRINARKALGIPENSKTVMIEAGKNGAANYAVIIGSLVKFGENKPLNIIAACGENEAYLEKLGWLTRGVPKNSSEFKALMFEMKELYQPKTIRKALRVGRRVFDLKPIMTRKEVEDLITNGLPQNVKVLAKGYGPLEPLRSASDIILTKPGGLSTAELGAEGRPMVILQEYASGEALPNGPLFASKGLSVINADISVIGSQVYDLLGNQEQLRLMHSASEKFRREFQLEQVLLLVKSVEAAKAERVSTAASVATTPEVPKEEKPVINCRAIGQ